MAVVTVRATLVPPNKRGGGVDLWRTIDPVTLMTSGARLTNGRGVAVRTMTIQALVHYGSGWI